VHGPKIRLTVCVLRQSGVEALSSEGPCDHRINDGTESCGPIMIDFRWSLDFDRFILHLIYSHIRSIGSFFALFPLCRFSIYWCSYGLDDDVVFVS
jgi:hypothetical protein